MDVLIVGSGGREHALAWKIRQSPKVNTIYCAPGNGGTADIAENVDIRAEDIKALAGFAKKNRIALTVVGPEAPLVAGIVDVFEDQELPVFGPGRQAARLEGSKIFAKEIMKKYRVPTADFLRFTRLEEARSYLNRISYPVVVKADGLAAGKGVYICATKQEATEALNDIMKNRVFKDAGDRVVIEQYLEGQEASILAVCDGRDFVLLDSSQDHKRIFDNDQGPNTGGMGAYSPAPVISGDLMERIGRDIIRPVVEGMAGEGVPFKGVLYAGLMITAQGPKVLEFNVRFGDPEAQAVLPRLKTDLVELMLAAIGGRLKKVRLEWDPRTCVCVVMSSQGYPGSYEKGKRITGLEDAARDPDTVVFHAGTRKTPDGIVTSGGRVLGVSGFGDSIESAIKKAYNSVNKIHFDGAFYRNDIGAKALKIF